MLAVALALPCCTTAPKVGGGMAGYCSATKADIERLVPAGTLRESCVLSRTSDDDLPYELCLEWVDNCDEAFEF
jgi:hypothetical protein